MICKLLFVFNADVGSDYLNFTTLRNAFELTTGGGVIAAPKFSLAGNSEAAAAGLEKQGTVFGLEPVPRRDYFLGKLYLEYQWSVRLHFCDFAVIAWNQLKS